MKSEQHSLQSGIRNSLDDMEISEHRCALCVDLGNGTRLVRCRTWLVDTISAWWIQSVLWGAVLSSTSGTTSGSMVAGDDDLVAVFLDYWDRAVGWRGG